MATKTYQENKQFPITYSFDPDYEEIESTIPMGVSEDGVVTFEPLDPLAPESGLQGLDYSNLPQLHQPL